MGVCTDRPTEETTDQLYSASEVTTHDATEIRLLLLLLIILLSGVWILDQPITVLETDLPLAEKWPLLSSAEYLSRTLVIYFIHRVYILQRSAYNPYTFVKYSTLTSYDCMLQLLDILHSVTHTFTRKLTQRDRNNVDYTHVKNTHYRQCCSQCNTDRRGVAVTARTLVEHRSQMASVIAGYQLSHSISHYSEYSIRALSFPQLIGLARIGRRRRWRTHSAVAAAASDSSAQTSSAVHCTTSFSPLHRSLVLDAVRRYNQWRI